MWQKIKERITASLLIISFGLPEFLPPLLALLAGAALGLAQ